MLFKKKKKKREKKSINHLFLLQASQLQMKRIVEDTILM